mgnify:CR=1 FL=1|jgi:hypothetical protein
MGTREDWVLEQERRKLLQDQIVSERKKEKFIKDIKSGLGEKILKEPNKKQKKITILQKLKKAIGWN